MFIHVFVLSVVIGCGHKAISTSTWSARTAATSFTMRVTLNTVVSGHAHMSKFLTQIQYLVKKNNYNGL